ncbi:MAG TPA: hypothetical protein VHP38_17675 [Ruminiclostridium sp.]|nr:hypothetical protein [Ruminiclostridium sp.]
MKKVLLLAAAFSVLLWGMVLSSGASVAGAAAVSPEGRELQYTGEDKASDSAQPDHLTLSTPKWYGFVEYADCNLYWDIHSIFAWPEDNPTTVEIMVKWVWNELGREERKAIVDAQNPRSGRCDNISYTKVNYLFSASENRMIILGVTDYNDKNQSVAFSTGSEWQDIVPGSKDDMARQLALNWLNDSEGE